MTRRKKNRPVISIGEDGHLRIGKLRVCDVQIGKHLRDDRTAACKLDMYERGATITIHILSKLYDTTDQKSLNEMVDELIKIGVLRKDCREPGLPDWLLEGFPF